jgi:hypothetical protein
MSGMSLQEGLIYGRLPARLFLTCQSNAEKKGEKGSRMSQRMLERNSCTQSKVTRDRGGGEELTNFKTQMHWPLSSASLLRLPLSCWSALRTERRFPFSIGLAERKMGVTWSSDDPYPITFTCSPHRRESD